MKRVKKLENMEACNQSVFRCITEVVKIGDVNTLQKNIDNDPIIIEQMTNLG